MKCVKNEPVQNRQQHHHNERVLDGSPKFAVPPGAKRLFTLEQGGQTFNNGLRCQPVAAGTGSPRPRADASAAAARAATAGEDAAQSISRDSLQIGWNHDRCWPMRGQIGIMA